MKKLRTRLADIKKSLKKIKKSPRKITPKNILFTLLFLGIAVIVLFFGLQIIGSCLLFLATGYISFFGNTFSVSPIIMLIFYGLIIFLALIWFFVKPSNLQKAENHAKKIAQSSNSQRRRFAKIN